MDYKRAYRILIEKRKAVPAIGLIERHHIVPRCLGGSNDKENIVRLTPREHFVCHHLLAKIHGGGLWAAYYLMSCPGSKSAKGIKVTSRQYQTARKRFVEYMSTFKGSKNGHYGRRHSDEAKRKISDIRKRYSEDKHPRAINDVLEWEHKDGELFTGSHFDLSKVTGIPLGNLRKVAAGALFSYKGWMCKNSGRKDMRSGVNTNTADKKTYKWTHKDGREFIGTRFDAREQIGITQEGASRLVIGKSKAHKGWSVCHL